MHTMRLLWTVTLALAASSAAAQWITGSKASDWKAGEAMARCSAFYLFAAELSTARGLPAGAESVANSARGWHLASMVLLSSGASRQGFDADKSAQGIAGVRLAVHRADFEQGGAAALSAIQADHRQQCDHLQPMAEALISALRKSAN